MGCMRQHAFSCVVKSFELGTGWPAHALAEQKAGDVAITDLVAEYGGVAACNRPEELAGGVTGLRVRRVVQKAQERAEETWTELQRAGNHAAVKVGREKRASEVVAHLLRALGSTSCQEKDGREDVVELEVLGRRRIPRKMNLDEVVEQVENASRESANVNVSGKLLDAARCRGYRRDRVAPFGHAKMLWRLGRVRVATLLAEHAFPLLLLLGWASAA